MFEDLIGKKCRIVKKDGFVKVGIIESIENGYIKLKMSNINKVEYIRNDKENIISIGEIVD